MPCWYRYLTVLLMLGNVLSNFPCFNFWKIERIWSISMMHDVKDTHLQPDQSTAPQNPVFFSRAGFMLLHGYRGAQFSGWNGRSAPYPASLLLPPASSPRLPWHSKCLHPFDRPAGLVSLGSDLFHLGGCYLLWKLFTVLTCPFGWEQCAHPLLVSTLTYWCQNSSYISVVNITLYWPLNVST